MKKTSIGIYVLVIMFLMCSCSMPAAEAAPWQNDDSIQLSIEKIIALVYENKDIGENNDFNEMMDTGISKYLADKIAVEQYVTNLNGTGKENYDVQVRLREKKTEAAELYFTFQVITTYNYMTAKDFDTEISEEVIVTYDREKELITDFYSPFNYFDISIRGENVKALKDIPEEKYRKALERLMNDIGMEYKSEEVPLSNNEQSNLSASKTSTLTSRRTHSSDGASVCAYVTGGNSDGTFPF